MAEEKPTLDDVKRLAAALGIEYQDGGAIAFGLDFHGDGKGDMFSIPGGVPIAHRMLSEINRTRKQSAQHLKEAEAENEHD